jgi:hypothetical protein
MATQVTNSGSESTQEVSKSQGTTPAAENSSTGETSSSQKVPAYLEEVNEMASATLNLLSTFADYSNVNSISSMSIAQTVSQLQIANEQNVNSEWEQANEQQQKEQKWGLVGQIFGVFATVCLLPLDMFFGAGAAGVAISGLTGFTKDLVGWVADVVQDIDPNLSATDCKVISTCILIVTAVIAFVAIGVLTAGAGDAVILEGAADVGADALLEEGGTELVDLTAKGAEDVVADGVTDVTEDAAKDVKKAADRAPSTKDRVKRGAKFGIFAASQLTMQTNLLPLIVQAATNDSDSTNAKIAELMAFIVQCALCIPAMIGSAMIEAPSFLDQKFAGNSIVSNAKQLGRMGSIGSTMVSATSDFIAGGYSAAEATSTYNLSEAKYTSDILKSTSQITSDGSSFNENMTESDMKMLEDINYSDLANWGGTVWMSA